MSRSAESSEGLEKEENLKQEFALHRAGGGRGRLLCLCHEVLLSIPPTSVEAERDFSTLALVLGERRASLNPETLDNIFILRKAFKHKML